MLLVMVCMTYIDGICLGEKGILHVIDMQYADVLRSIYIECTSSDWCDTAVGLQAAKNSVLLVILWFDNKHCNLDRNC